jgi:predicted DNA-binding protein
MRGGKREGAGRKRIGTTKQITLTLPDSLWEQLEKRCIKDGKKQAEWLREIVEKSI